MVTIRFLSVQEIIAVNVAIINKYSPGEQLGVKNQSLLESAVYRPPSSAFGEDAYPSLFEKAAALFESIGQNHPFHNGNKRAAFTALVVFLSLNGFHFNEYQATEDFTVDMVNRKYTFDQLVKISQHHTKASDSKKH